MTHVWSQFNLDENKESYIGSQLYSWDYKQLNGRINPILGISAKIRHANTPISTEKLVPLGIEYEAFWWS